MGNITFNIKSNNNIYTNIITINDIFKELIGKPFIDNETSFDNWIYDILLLAENYDAVDEDDRRQRMEGLANIGMDNALKLYSALRKFTKALKFGSSPKEALSLKNANEFFAKEFEFHLGTKAYMAQKNPSDLRLDKNQVQTEFLEKLQSPSDSQKNSNNQFLKIVVIGLAIFSGINSLFKMHASNVKPGKIQNSRGQNPELKNVQGIQSYSAILRSDMCSQISQTAFLKNDSCIVSPPAAISRSDMCRPISETAFLKNDSCSVSPLTAILRSDMCSQREAMNVKDGSALQVKNESIRTDIAIALLTVPIFLWTLKRKNVGLKNSQEQAVIKPSPAVAAQVSTHLKSESVQEEEEAKKRISMGHAIKELSTTEATYKASLDKTVKALNFLHAKAPVNSASKKTIKKIAENYKQAAASSITFQKKLAQAMKISDPGEQLESIATLYKSENFKKYKKNIEDCNVLYPEILSLSAEIDAIAEKNEEFKKCLASFTSATPHEIQDFRLFLGSNGVAVVQRMPRHLMVLVRLRSYAPASSSSSQVFAAIIQAFNNDILAMQEKIPKLK